MATSKTEIQLDTKCPAYPKQNGCPLADRIAKSSPQEKLKRMTIASGCLGCNRYLEDLAKNTEM